MKRLRLGSLRVRLTLWYTGALVMVVLTLAVATRWALHVSLDHALDQGLRYRLIGLHGFVDENSAQGLERLGTRLRELNTLGELLQVFGPNGEVMAQSYGLARHHVSTKPPPDPGASMRFRNAGPPWFPVRMATQRIYVGGKPLIIEVADPQAKYRDVLRELYSFLLVALPCLLLIAGMGGYWLSTRALAPVDQIIREARSMDPADLAARLSVPLSGDELQRLSETLNQMLERVERSVVHVRRFTADASHELRAPMTLIYTAAQFALRRDRSADELKDALQKILREAKRCTELINQLLTLARSDSGVTRTAFTETDLAGLLREVVGEVTALGTSKGLHITCTLPASPVHAAVDERSFRRMLIILLDNAIKYTPEGGSVIASLFDDENGAKISVADTGTGISPDQLPFIFDRFWRADQVRSRDAGGTGLGLAIARDIAQHHGAQLTVESSVGTGSTFTVLVPHPAGAHPADDVATQESA